MTLKKFPLIVSICAIVFLCVLCYAANYMLNFAIVRQSGSNDSIHKMLAVSEDAEQVAREQRAALLEKRMTLQAQEWGTAACTKTQELTAEDGIVLHGYFFMQPDSSVHRWAVIVHGYNDIAQEFWSYAQAYYEKGWNVLTPDLRASGKSQGSFIGMGWLDRRDIILWLSEVVKLDAQAQIVLHGFSMGAAAVMMVSGEKDFPEAVKVCIEDSGYSSVWAELEDKLHKMYHLPSFPIMHAVSVLSKFRAGYSFREADCVKQLRKNKTPMLFIHGDADDYNPFYMQDIVYEADACEQKKKLVVHGARHVMSAFTEPDVYWNTVWNFIEENW
ncbi:MAG: alpha/beta hydrolase [Treponema sp.]|nr:alpha/beta hydrolase [Treponema sp.]